MHIYAVGDIHGCYDKLAELIGKLNFRKTDTVVFLGDYIDRGAQSRKVVDYLIALKEDRPEGKTIFLKGNHEKMFIDYLDDRNSTVFFANGGEATLKDYKVGENVVVPERHMNFFNNLKLFHETEKYIFVHAGLRASVSIGCQSEEDLLWIRGDFIFSDFEFRKKVIYGHSPTKDYRPFFDKNKIGIDTGAVYGGYLTAIQLPEEKIYQA